VTGHAPYKLPGQRQMESQLTIDGRTCERLQTWHEWRRTKAQIKMDESVLDGPNQGNVSSFIITS
jgi:hypothetical protein